MATPNKTVPHRGRIFQNPKTHLLPYSFKKRVASVDGSVEGSQIGDSTGIEPRISGFIRGSSLNLNYGYIGAYDSLISRRLGYIDDWWSRTWLASGLHLWCVDACVSTWLVLACLFIVDWYLVMRFEIGIDGQIVCRFCGSPCHLHMTICCMATLSLAWLFSACVCGARLYPLISELLVLVDYSSLIDWVVWESFPTVCLWPS